MGRRVDRNPQADSMTQNTCWLLALWIQATGRTKQHGYRVAGGGITGEHTPRCW